MSAVAEKRAKIIRHWYADCSAWVRPHDGMTAKQRRRMEKRQHVETNVHAEINCGTCKTRGPSE